MSSPGGSPAMPPPPIPLRNPSTARSSVLRAPLGGLDSVGLGQPPASASATYSRTSSGTPHPSAGLVRPQSSASQQTTTSHYRSRSVASSSYPSRLRGNASTTSGRKSRATSSVWGSDGHVVICAVSEARGVSPSVGLAFVNITTNEAILSQICDSQFYVKTLHKIQVHEPSAILLVSTAFHPKSNLLSVIEEELHGVPIEPLDRKYWSETAGLEFIHSLAFREDIQAIQVATQGNFYATCSFAAAIKYTEFACHLSIMPQSLRIRYQPSENSMMIDIPTIHSLELLQNLQNPKSKCCLFGLLNETLTPMGSRMLRSNILQPSTQVEHTLTPRLDALDEMTVKEDMFFDIRKALKAFTDAEKLLTTLVIVPQGASIYESEQSINHVLKVKAFVNAVSPLYDALGSARSELLQRVRDTCRPELIQPVLNLITETINDDVTYVDSPLNMRHQRTYAVKSGINGLLDVARQIYKEGTDDVHSLVEELNSQFDMSAEIRYDQNRKYWLRLRQCDMEDRDIPDVLINQVKRGVYIECQTLGLIQLNTRITDSHNEAVMLSDRVVHELLDGIRGHIANLFRVCEGISLLDMLTAFAHSITSRDYSRPEFGHTMALQAARHPICDTIQQRFVPNDVFASEQHRFQIITGCNMSGKSTYIRMISLLQIMAQIGCFVPAEYASFPIIQQLFVRMSTDDSIEANMSTFSAEMREMAFILRNIDEKSLVIIDELGRGTSTRDGLAIALAISEALIQSGSLVWFATHFSQLAKVLGSRPGVLNLHLTTEISQGGNEECPTMTMLYKITSGENRQAHYGLNLAKVIGFPDEFIENAELVSKKLKEQIEQKRRSSRHHKLTQRRRLLLNLHETLKQMHESDMDDAALGSYMKRLQDEFVVRMDEIENGGQAEEESELDADGMANDD
ncbi:uncharacterized protein JN550_003312 [Neoarthrinium moseri]|uniref:uncharacterized protein n=1 Tax=Neoarthrinium moseri TaxID=1658444 RepID=UPI001FDC45AE|nr:uncharacterized protein JN550_003312 [Neoarthrinium moseri]KAI1873059.1 hypothetical protein JN550_003312 [Neoarthrinium moseri]